MKKIPYIMLVIGSLFFATGCDKATVLPEQSISSVQDGVSKDRGIEARVTGTYDAKPFTATLRVNTFFIDGTLKATAVLDQVGGGLSRTDVAFLQATSFTFDVRTLQHTSDTFSFYPSLVGRGGGKAVVLDNYYEVVINADTRKFNQISGYLTSISQLWTEQNTDGTLKYVVPGSGDLTTAGYALLCQYYNTISSTVGRY
ncbi:hypothetical protein [Hymenobacter jeollabukensis]|uniref:Uncharacterized protein n=1 Tax=Hymenobacter jeollabukensis TaxID=2025313 RepID=A0A5R8WJQ9_9BACT|nr:hypothetical protein [Hymenobacter jeollabukensis]TLM89061.1 hypothetical protein FDY95_21055 [Hymenobacter jeollabukensis]